jgi:hypothetical protein
METAKKCGIPLAWVGTINQRNFLDPGNGALGYFKFIINSGEKSPEKVEDAHLQLFLMTSLSSNI